MGKEGALRCKMAIMVKRNTATTITAIIFGVLLISAIGYGVYYFRGGNDSLSEQTISPREQFLAIEPEFTEDEKSFLLLNPVEKEVTPNNKIASIKDKLTQEDKIKVELLSNDGQAGRKSAVLKLIVNKAITIPKDKNNNLFRFDVLKTDSSYRGINGEPRYYILKNVSKETIVDDFTTIRGPIYDSPQNMTQVGSRDEQVKIGSHVETYKQEEWVPFSYYDTFFDVGVYTMKIEVDMLPVLGDNVVDWIPTLYGERIPEMAVFKQSFTNAMNFTGLATDTALVNNTWFDIIINISNMSDSRFCVQCPNDLAIYREDNLLVINISDVIASNGTGRLSLLAGKADLAVGNQSTFEVRIYGGDIGITSAPTQSVIDPANIPSRADSMTEIGTATGKGDNHITKCNADSQESIFNNASRSCDFVNTTQGWQHGAGNFGNFTWHLDNNYIINQFQFVVAAVSQGSGDSISLNYSLNNLTTSFNIYYQASLTACDSDCTLKFIPILANTLQFQGNDTSFANYVPNTREMALFRYAGLNFTRNGGVDRTSDVPPGVGIPAPFLNQPADGVIISSNPMLNWSNISSSNIYNYTVEVDNNNDFSSPEFKNMSVKEQVNVTGVFAINLTADGNYTVRASTYDGASNYSKIRSFILDLTYPKAYVVSPISNGTYNINNITLNVSTVDFTNYSQFFNLNDGANITYRHNTSFTPEQGLNKIFFQTQDLFNRTTTNITYFYVDSRAPIWYDNRTNPASPASHNSGPFEFNITVADVNLTITRITFDGTNYSLPLTNGTAVNFTRAGLGSRTYEYNWSFFDAFGNNNATQTYFYNVSNTVPTIPHINYPSNRTFTGTHNMSLSCSGSTDADGDAINYEYYLQYATNPPTTLRMNNSITAINVTGLVPDGEYWWRCRANDNITSTEYNETRQFKIYSSYLNNVTTEYTLSVPEGENTDFYGNISINNLTTKGVTAVLFYNQTAKTTTNVTINHNLSRWTSNFITPLIQGDTVTNNWLWNISIELLNGTVVRNTSFAGTQTVTNINLFSTSCGPTNASQALVANFTFWEEINRLNLTENFDATFITYGDDNSVNDTYVFGLTNRSFIHVCISPVYAKLQSVATISYDQAAYDVRYYYFKNRTLDNITDNIELHSLEIVNGVPITINVVDETETGLENVMVDIQKYYPDVNLYRTIAMALSGNDGVDVVPLRQNDAIYRFLAYNGDPSQPNQPIVTTPNTKITGTELFIRILPATAAEVLRGIYDMNKQTTLVYTNSTGRWFASYNDPSSITEKTCMKVVKTGASKVVEANFCNASKTGTLTYSVSNNSGQYAVTVYTLVEGKEYVLKSSINNVIQELSSVLGLFGAFMTALVSLGIALLFRQSPTTMLIGFWVGLVAMSVLGFVSIGLGTIMGITGSIGILIYKMRS